MNVVVLLSTYNGELYIEEQIESILNQKDCAVTLVVRDDMSTDKTCDILENYSRQGKLQWYRDGENLGAAKSFMNLLIHAPEADYYSFADQDDVWNCDKLSHAISVLDGNIQPAVYYANAALVDGQLHSLGGTVYHGEQRPSILMALCSCNVLGCTMVINKALADIIRCGKSPQKILMHDNYICAVCAVCGGSILYDNYVSMLYRQHGNNVIGAKINHSGLSRAREKVKWITQRRTISIGDQCAELLKIVDGMSEQGRRYAQMVAKYRDSVAARMQLCAILITLVIKKSATKHELLNAVKILFGNA